jgi:hypothetical protein
VGIAENQPTGDSALHRLSASLDNSTRWTAQSSAGRADRALRHSASSHHSSCNSAHTHGCCTDALRTQQRFHDGGDHGIPDLDGLANFVVDSARLASSWTLSSDNVEAGSCTSIEYGITPGTHRVLRFTVSTPNIGDADAVVGDPLAHVDPNHDGDFGDSDGLFEYAPCHNHFHYKHYATYELLPVLAGGALGARFPASTSCSTTLHSPLHPGDYVIRITVNPPYLPDSTDACPVRDEQNFCRVLRESNYSDNVATMRITLP